MDQRCQRGGPDGAGPAPPEPDSDRRFAHAVQTALDRRDNGGPGEAYEEESEEPDANPSYHARGACPSPRSEAGT